MIRARRPQAVPFPEHRDIRWAISRADLFAFFALLGMGGFAFVVWRAFAP